MTEVKNTPETATRPRGMEVDFNKLLADAWRGLLKYWQICLVIVLVAGIAAGIYAGFFYRPKYEASATFAVNPQNADPDESIIVYQDTSAGMNYDGTTLTPTITDSASFIGSATASSLAESFPYVIVTDVLQDKICEDLGTSKVPAQVSASNLKDTSMITLTATGRDPQQTYDVLLSVMENYPVVAKYVIGSTALVVIIPPEFPDAPVKKNAMLVILLYGLLIGAAICIGWLVLYSLLRTTVRTRNDVREKLGQHTVGVLPQVIFKRYTMAIDHSILLTNPRIGDGFLEAMRVLRNAFLHRLTEKDKIILITSTAPGEGKSTVTVNLTLSLADAGKKVLLIDGDIRNSSVAGILSLEPDFEENSEIPYKIVRNEKGYDLLLFDPKNRRRWNFMQGSSLPALLSDMEEQYDLILIDTPPAGLLSDAQAIAQSADTALYIVMEDTVRISRIRKSITELQKTGVQFLGCVLNGVTSGISGYGENYGYSYGGYSRYHTYGRYARYGYDKGYSYGTDSQESETPAEEADGNTEHTQNEQEQS